MIAFIAACGGVTHTEVPASKLSPSTCRVVQHNMGATCVPVNPQRLIVLNSFDIGHVLSLGIQPIGTMRKTNLEYLGERIEGMEAVDFSLEKILLLKPDLILAHNGFANYSLLFQISPTVVLDSYRNDKWKIDMNNLARILGKEEEAQQVWKHYYQRIEKLKLDLGDSYKDKKISVFGVYPPDTRIFIEHKETFAGSILEEVGLQRPKSQIVQNAVSAPLSEEKLEDIDGDVVFVLIMGDGGKKAFDELQHKPLWKRLKAVQNGQVFTVDRQPWHIPSPIAADIVIDDLSKYLVNTP